MLERITQNSVYLWFLYYVDDHKEKHSLSDTPFRGTYAEAVDKCLRHWPLDSVFATFYLSKSTQPITSIKT